MKEQKTSTFNLKIKYRRDIENIKKNRPWYASATFGTVALILLALIDFAGFVQGGLSFIGALKTASTLDVGLNYMSMSVMLTGFTAAFEGSTIYIAYAFTIKLYNYDRSALTQDKHDVSKNKLSKFISTSSLGWISFICFALGVVANIVFRVGLCYYEICNATGKNDIIIKQVTITIVMIILPVITSILNFVVSCFSFDPLLFELNRIGKRIAFLTSQNAMIKNNMNTVDDLITNISQLKESEEYYYTQQFVRVATLRPMLRTKAYEYKKRGN